MRAHSMVEVGGAERVDRFCCLILGDQDLWRRRQCLPKSCDKDYHTSVGWQDALEALPPLRVLLPSIERCHVLRRRRWVQTSGFRRKSWQRSNSGTWIHKRTLYKVRKLSGLPELKSLSLISFLMLPFAVVICSVKGYLDLRKSSKTRVGNSRMTLLSAWSWQWRLRFSSRTTNP